MQSRETSDPVSLIIKACRKNEDEAKRICQLLAEERQHHLKLDSTTTVHLSEEQLGDFAQRFSSEVEPGCASIMTIRPLLLKSNKEDL